MNVPIPPIYRIARRAGNQGARPADMTRVAVEKSTTASQALLKAKQTVNFSSFNTRTLTDISQRGELTASASIHQHDIICVQEHRFFHDDVLLKHHDMGKGWLLVTSSAVKNTVNAAIGGVGLLLSPKAQKSLNSIESITPRILVASFNGNPKTTIICCYSPTNVSEESEIEEFYNELSGLTRQIPKHNVILIGGDFNAKLGNTDSFQNSFHAETNRNGEWLKDFLIENKLVCLNTLYQKRTGKKWTFTYPNGTNAQIDFILINKKWVNCALNCEPFSSFSSLSSDHRIIIAKIRLSLRSNKLKTAKSPRYDWKKLRDQNLANQFKITLSNRYQSLQDESNEITANSSYRNFETACAFAADELIPSRRKAKQTVPWESEDILQKRADLKAALYQRDTNPSRENRYRYRAAQTKLKHTYRTEQETYINSKIELIENSAINKQAALAWKTVNEISGRKSSNKAKLKASDQKERIDKWKVHFANLLGKAPRISIKETARIVEGKLNIKKGTFSMEELKAAKKQMKSGKACGLDNIPAEVWLTGDFDDELLDFCNKVYQLNPIDRWTEGCILPFPKKGDLGLTTNYRGITLTAISAKVYNLLLLNRIRPKLEKILRKNQNGFRQKRSTEGQILTIRRIIEGIKAKNLTAVLMFIDFSKAFDSVHRGKLKEIILAYGIPDEIASAIMMLYQNSKSMVRSPDGDTDFFYILAGVLQGDTLAPFLFILCLDYALRTSVDLHTEFGFTLTKSRSSRYPAEIITDVDYADDLALLSDTIDEATELLHLVETAASEIGLYINSGKTEFIAYNQNGAIKSKSGHLIKCVNDFSYLGSNIRSTKKDIDIRKAKAWKALDGLTVIWKSSLSDHLKRGFFRAVVESVLTYGSSTWTLTRQQEKSLDGTYTRLLRAALNVSWKKHVTNKSLYGHLSPISVVIRERRLKLAGHLWRNKSELASSVLFWCPKHGRRSVGRPLRVYTDQLVDDTGLRIEDIPVAMSDRLGWRKHVKRIREFST